MQLLQRAAYNSALVALFFLRLSAADVQLNTTRWIQSPGYPNPYRQLPKDPISDTFRVPNGQGVAFLFSRLFIDINDYFTVCPADASTKIPCTYKKGADMTHPGAHEFLSIDSSARYIVSRNVSYSPSLVQSGYAAAVVPFDLTERWFSPCNGTVSLDDGTTQFVLSQNYPNATTYIGNCTITFTTSNSQSGIRVALYDFRFGFDAHFEMSDGSNTITLKGFEVVDDEPQGYYFQKSMTLKYQLNSAGTSFTQNRFYAIVNSYTPVATPSSAGCTNVGAIDLKVGEKRDFGTVGYPSTAHAANLDCRWVISTSSPNTTLGILTMYQSEKCCDIMLLTGIDYGSPDGFNFQGDQGGYYYLAFTNKVDINFTSDGVEQLAGFSFTATAIDCDCKSRHIRIDQESDTRLTSPGYDLSDTYCAALNCSWTIEWDDPSLVVSFLFNTVQLRQLLGLNYDSINATDAWGRKIADNLVGVVKPDGIPFATGGLASFTFVSYPNPFTDYAMMSLDSVSKGFDVTIRAIKPGTVEITPSLSESAPFSKMSVMPWDYVNNISYIYHFKSARGNNIGIFPVIGANSSAVVEAFDGPALNYSAQLPNQNLYAAPYDGCKSESNFRPIPLMSLSDQLTVRFYAPVASFSYLHLVAADIANQRPLVVLGSTCADYSTTIIANQQLLVYNTAALFMIPVSRDAQQFGVRVQSPRSKLLRINLGMGNGFGYDLNPPYQVGGPPTHIMGPYFTILSNETTTIDFSVVNIPYAYDINLTNVTRVMSADLANSEAPFIYEWPTFSQTWYVNVDVGVGLQINFDMFEGGHNATVSLAVETAFTALPPQTYTADEHPNSMNFTTAVRVVVIYQSPGGSDKHGVMLSFVPLQLDNGGPLGKTTVGRSHSTTTAVILLLASSALRSFMSRFL